MVASFVAYIDESGDEGFRFGHGSSDWFVLSAVVTRREEDLKVVKLVDEIKLELKKPPAKPLHSCKLKHEQKVPLVDKISKAKLWVITVLIYKPYIRNKEKFEERYRLYFYSTRLLLERVSWLCQENHGIGNLGDGSCEIIFSNRSAMSYKELKAYLGKLKKQSNDSTLHVFWPAIRIPAIRAVSHNKLRGLQIADAVAHSFFKAIEPLHGFTEDRYVRILKSVVYAHRGTYLGYGIKVWPGIVEAVIKVCNWFKYYEE